MGSYYEDSRGLWLLYDLDQPEAEERMQATFASWQGRAELMALDSEHPILVLLPGGAKLKKARRT